MDGILRTCRRDDIGGYVEIPASDIVWIETVLLVSKVHSYVHVCIIE